MTAPAWTCTAALPRRAGLLIGLLAVFAGIFGMHVMTGAPSGHSPAAASPVSPGAHPAMAVGNGGLHPASHASRSHPADGSSEWHAPSGPAGTAQQMRSCSDSGTGAHAMGGSCIPTAKTGSLSAPSPGTAVAGIVPPGRAAGSAAAHWSFHPGTPSPGELSISRT